MLNLTRLFLGGPASQHDSVNFEVMVNTIT